MSAPRPRFASVVLDVDSTLCGVEGIDWLAQRRGPEIAEHTRALTDKTMNGEIALEAVYSKRLSVIRPSREDIDALAQVYRQTIAAGAAEAITRLRAAGARVVLVSGGIRQAIAPLARELNVELHAVDITFDNADNYASFDSASKLATQHGKLDVVRALALPRAILAVGDGATDVAMKPAVDQFAAYTGFVRRDAVLRAADCEVATYEQVLSLVFA